MTREEGARLQRQYGNDITADAYKAITLAELFGG